MTHRQIDDRLAAFGECLVILAQSAISTEPRERSLHNPSLRQDHEARHVVAAPNDLQNPPSQLSCPFDQPARVPAIGPDQLQPGEAALEQRQHQLGPVAVLNVGRVHHHSQDQAEGVYNDVALAPVDLLAGVVAACPPFSAVLTDWLSMIAAEGEGLRPSSSRTWRRRAS